MPRRHAPPQLTCDLCGETIPMWEPHYEMPDGDFICEECVLEWCAQYRVTGEVDLGYGED